MENDNKTACDETLAVPSLIESLQPKNTRQTQYLERRSEFKF